MMGTTTTTGTTGIAAHFVSSTNFCMEGGCRRLSAEALPIQEEQGTTGIAARTASSTNICMEDGCRRLSAEAIEAQIKEEGEVFDIDNTSSFTFGLKETICGFSFNARVHISWIADKI